MCVTANFFAYCRGNGEGNSSADPMWKKMLVIDAKTNQVHRNVLNILHFSKISENNILNLRDSSHTGYRLVF